MSTQVLIQSISEKLDFIALPRVNWRKILASGFILAISLLVFYIFQISGITRASFLVSKYEKEIVLLSQQNKSLETSLSQKNSLGDLELALKDFNYEKVSKIYYIQAMDTMVAVKR